MDRGIDKRRQIFARSARFCQGHAGRAKRHLIGRAGAFACHGNIAIRRCRFGRIEALRNRCLNIQPVGTKVAGQARDVKPGHADHPAA